MENQIADALLKIAEVHDRRLGEIAKSLEKLAEAFTHYDVRDLALPMTGIDHLSSQICGIDMTLGDNLSRIADVQAGEASD